MNLDCNPNLTTDFYKQLFDNTLFPNLTSISLTQNQLSDKHVVEIQNELKANKTIRNLNLWSNRLGDAGALVVAECLLQNTALVSLSLSKNLICESGALELFDVYFSIVVGFTILEILLSSYYWT